MNKKQFIKNLKERLSILEENEILDIANEYECIINDKVKNGETEEKAISEFGDMDELVTEILKAYKINPKFKKDKIKVEDFEDFVKVGATKLTDFTKKVVNEIKVENISVEFIFEIIIKAIILLVLLALLRLPFMFVSYLGESILNIFLIPLDKVLIVLFDLLIWILYFISCVLVGIAMFKNNIKTNDKVKKENRKEEVKIVEKENTKKKEKVIEKEEIKKQKIESKNNFKATDVLIGIVKIFAIIFILIPLMFVIVGIVSGIVISIYYLFLGISCLGIVLTLIGLLIITSALYNTIKDAFKQKNHNLLASVIVSIIFITFGCILTFNWFSKITYYDDNNFANFNYATEVYTYTIDSNTIFDLDDSYTTYVDNALLDDNVRIEVTYYDNVVSISENNFNNVITISSNNNVSKNNVWKIYNNVIDDLKDETIRGYDNLDNINIKVYANSTTLLKLNDN